MKVVRFVCTALPTILGGYAVGTATSFSDWFCAIALLILGTVTTAIWVAALLRAHRDSMIWTDF